jgi:hypothetical protein
MKHPTNLRTPLVTEGPNIEFNLLNHTNRNSVECRENEKKIQNEPSVGASAGNIQATLEPPRYRGPQH